MHVFDLDTHFLEVVGQVFRHLLGKGGDKSTLSPFYTRIDFTQEIVHLSHGRAHFHLRIEKTCRTNNLLDDSIRLFHLIVSWCRRHINDLVDMAFKLLSTKRAVVQGRWQTEAIVDQHLLARAVSIIHALDLSHGHVAFVNHDKKIFWEEVQEGVRWLSFASSIHMAGIVLHPIGVTHLPQHFNIVLSPLFQALGFQELAFFFKDLQLLFQLSLNFSNGHFHMIVIGHKVSSWENRQVVHFTKDLTSQSFNLTDAINLIPKKLNPKGMLIPRGRENLYYIPTDTEFPPLKVDVVTLKLDIHQVVEQFITRNLQTWTQTNDAIRVFLRRTQTIDTGNRCDDNDVITF